MSYKSDSKITPTNTHNELAVQSTAAPGQKRKCERT